MKKLCLVVLLVLTIALLIACGETVTTTPTTTEPPTNTFVPVLPEGERIVKNTYTAVLNDAEWNPGSLDTSGYDFFGLGAEIYQKIRTKYTGYTLSYVIVKDGVETPYTATTIFQAMTELGNCGVKLTVNASAKTCAVKIYPVECTGQLSWKAVTAQAGSYMRFNFNVSLSGKYAITVTAEKGGAYATSEYTHEDIEVTDDGAKLTAMGQVTVPNTFGKTYYINLCIDTAGYPVIDSIPLNVVEAKYDTSAFRAVFIDDWTLINDELYMETLAYHFYTTYPRLYARWGGTGKEPTVVNLRADRNYDGMASAGGTTIRYSVSALNGGTPTFAGGAFTHEATHIVQKYNYSYSSRDKLIPGHENVEKHYFTENMANYGRHRYWSYNYSTSFIEEKDPMKSLEWGYGEYANAQLFFSWMDWNYPSKDLDGDGKVTTMEERGVIDYLVFKSKEWTGASIDDDPYTPGTVYNNWVKEKTGYNTFDLLRQEFARQVNLSNEGKEGGWECLVKDASGKLRFVGFANFSDNFITEGIANLPNPDYAVYGEIKPTAKTNPVLAAAVTTGDNLCLNASIAKVASQPTGDTFAAENLIDGKLDTRYQAQRASKLYDFNKIANEVVIDLGEAKTFDTYTLVGYNNSPAYVMKSWEIFVSTDNLSYTALDYQKDNTAKTVSVSFDDVTARYVKIRLFEPDQNNMGITRLCEFMLFDQNK